MGQSPITGALIRFGEVGTITCWSLTEGKESSVIGAVEVAAGGVQATRTKTRKIIQKPLNIIKE
jgi:hypothetical protein